jgi:tetrapyrrole methylase family protein/MazG family protein
MPTQSAVAGSIHVAGLGPGDESRLTLGVLKRLRSAEALYVRTARHPVVRYLESEGIRFETFDALYEKHDTFEATYRAIADTLFELAKTGVHVVYAVPGHPRVAEATVKRLIDESAARGVPVTVEGGESFLDEAFLRLGFDPVEGFQLLDAANVTAERLQPDLHTVISQVYDRFTASDVKLALMDVYPDNYPVVLAAALGVPGEERIETVPLYELDRRDDFGNLSLVYLPADRDERLVNRKFERLHDIVRILRSPEGCPWDREQTHRSIRKNLIEETCEVLETIDDDDPEAMCEELGDLLLQIMLHSQMEEEAGTFTVWDVIAGLNDKLIRRHPHVFGDRSANNAEEALQTWQDMKAREKKNAVRPSVLSGIPRDLSALLTAYKLQKKAAEVGFDWSRAEDVLAKVEEEINEIRQLMISAGERDESPEEERRERLAGEIGDLLFAAVNAARFANVDPEDALARTNRKFIARFRHIERRLREAGKTFKDTNLEEMDGWWEEAKRLHVEHDVKEK